MADRQAAHSVMTSMALPVTSASWDAPPVQWSHQMQNMAPAGLKFTAPVAKVFSSKGLFRMASTVSM